MSMRVGHGFDSHPFGDDPDRPMVLGGVVIDTDRCLVGHSDADVIAHACADALLGPAGSATSGPGFPTTTRRSQVRTASACWPRSSTRSPAQDGER